MLPCMEDLKVFYTGVIRSVLEFGAQIWNGNLTDEQSNDIERLQKRALKIILLGPVVRRSDGAIHRIVIFSTFVKCLKNCEPTDIDDT
jgi:hypothetical protein